MIKRYSDHAANERTFLAWVRTAIAVMAFGFIIEKFDLFLAFAASEATSRSLALHGQKFANGVGLATIFLGVAMIAVATFRFFRVAKDIESEEVAPSTGSRIDLALGILLALLGVSLILYMAHAVLPTV